MLPTTVVGIPSLLSTIAWCLQIIPLNAATDALVLTSVARCAQLRGCHFTVQAACKGSSVVSTDAIGLLSQQYFFTSTKLAALGTEAEILIQVHSHSHYSCSMYIIPITPKYASRPACTYKDTKGTLRRVCQTAHWHLVPEH